MNNTRQAHPPRAPPSYTMVTRMYKRSLRPVVLAFSFLAAIWSLLWGISALKDISTDNHDAPKLSVFDIILGVLYLVTFGIEVVGIIGAWLQRAVIVRIYAIASLGAAVMIAGAQVIRVIVHFAYKSELINECEILSQDGDVDSRIGLWGPFSSQQLTPQEAEDYCNSAWSHDSWVEIVWLLVAGFCAFFFASIAFAYMRQLIDPTSVVNNSRVPANNNIRASGNLRSRLGNLFSGSGGARNNTSSSTFPEHYAPAYEGAPELSYSRGYAAPAGPPPVHHDPERDDFGYGDVPSYEHANNSSYKLPGYGVGVTGELGAVKGGDEFNIGGGRDVKDADPFTDFERGEREERE